MAVEGKRYYEIQEAKNRAALPAAPGPLSSYGQGLNLNGANIAQYLSFLQSAYFGNDVVTEAGLFGLPSAWRCVNLRANAVGMMMRHAKVCDGAGNRLDIVPTIVSRPNVFYGSFNFWVEVVSTVIIHGNYIALITSVDVDGNPLQVTPVHPNNVSIDLSSGFPIYHIGDGTYSWRQVVHVRGLTTPGSYWGIGVLAAHLRGLSTQYDQQTYARTSYQSGGAPMGIIGIDTHGAAFPSDDELSRISTQWTSDHGSGNRKIAVMPNGLSFQPVQWTPEEMEFLESRRFSVAEMALMFNLDPADLGASIGGQSMTYANIEQREISRNINTYGADLHRVEDAWSDLLPADQYVEGNPDALLKMDTKSKYEAFSISKQWKTINEIRALDGLPPIDGGDVITGALSTKDTLLPPTEVDPNVE